VREALDSAPGKSSHAFDLLHDRTLEQLGRQKALRYHGISITIAEFAVARLDPGWFRGGGGKRDTKYSGQHDPKKETNLALSHVKNPAPGRKERP